jgi:hypothetical protein
LPPDHKSDHHPPFDIWYLTFVTFKIVNDPAAWLMAI